MNKHFHFIKGKSWKRVQTRARRLALMMTAYQKDPVNLFGLRSESVSLARRIAAYLRAAELRAPPRSTLRDRAR